MFLSVSIIGNVYDHETLHTRLVHHFHYHGNITCSLPIATNLHGLAYKYAKSRLTFRPFITIFLGTLAPCLL